MKYFAVEGTFQHPVDFSDPQTQAYLAGHLQFLEEGIRQGWILFSGPKPEGGGLLILKAESAEAARAHFDVDPFNIHGINAYTFTEFLFKVGQDSVTDWFA